MTGVCLYLRVSTDRQAERGLSLPEQDRALRDFCAHRKYFVVDTFTDAGISGRTDRRPEFQRMIEAASEKPPRFTKVVVYNWSRFFRSVEQSLMYAAKLQRLGVEVESMTENFGKGAAGKFGRTNALAAHEYISDMNGENALRGMLENARQGFVNGKVPYGYRAVERERRADKRKMGMEIDPQEAEVVRLMFKLYLEGDGKTGPKGIKAIVEHLNSNGHRVRKGGRFSVKFVDETLRRTAYVGRYVYNRLDTKTRRPKPESEHITISCPAIVSDAKFARVQQTLSDRNPRMTPPRVVNTPILLTGIARCGSCGAAMVKGTGKGGRYSYYMCSTRNRVGVTGCKGQRVPMAAADELVSGALLDQVLDPTRLAALLTELRKKNKVGREDETSRKAALTGELKKVAAEINNLMALVTSGVLSAEDRDLRDPLQRLKDRRDDIERKMAALTRRLEIPTGWAGPRKIEAFAKGIKDLWKGDDVRFRQAYMRLLVDNVEFTGPEIRMYGSKDVLAAAIAQGASAAPDAVRSFAREWRAIGDSNCFVLSESSKPGLRYGPCPLCTPPTIAASQHPTYQRSNSQFRDMRATAAVFYSLMLWCTYDAAFEELSMIVDSLRKPSMSVTLRGALLTTIALPFVLSAAPAAAKETRGYVISWFATAVNFNDFANDCPATAATGFELGEELTRRRDQAVIDGKPVSTRAFPAAVTKDPGLEIVQGKHAYGFDLGGPAKNKFIDPETGQQVDNQIWRAVGCHPNFAQRPPPEMPFGEALGWDALIDASPGWAMQISGDDLSKDGPVTITLDRTVRHLERDAKFGVRSNVTYVLDPSQRSNNVLQGEIREGVLTVKSGEIFMLAGFPWYTHVDLSNLKMRMSSSSEGNGKIEGYWGGHTSWHGWVYFYTARAANADPVAYYWNLQKLADADPDPVTGQNRKISTAWRMQAVPAFLANADGTVIATATSSPLGRVTNQTAAAGEAGAKPAGAARR